MKAIQTRYYSATNYRGSKIKAWVEYGDKPMVVWTGYDHGAADPHLVAAWALIDKWRAGGGYVSSERLIGGVLPNGDRCYCLPQDGFERP